MGAFHNLPQYFGRPLTEIAAECNYSASNILILEGRIDQLRTKFPEVYSALMSCTHNRDARTPLQYAQDLVASWLFEDYICKMLNDNGLRISKSGADQNREILSSRKVSASSDTCVYYNGHSRLMEIMTDYKGYWTRYKVMDLRDSKYECMRDSKSLFLGFSAFDGKFFILDFSKPIDAKFIAHHFPYGGKPAYQVPCRDLLKPFTAQSLISDIKACF